MVQQCGFPYTGRSEEAMGFSFQQQFFHIVHSFMRLIAEGHDGNVRHHSVNITYLFLYIGGSREITFTQQYDRLNMPL